MKPLRFLVGALFAVLALFAILWATSDDAAEDVTRAPAPEVAEVEAEPAVPEPPAPEVVAAPAPKVTAPEELAPGAATAPETAEADAPAPESAPSPERAEAPEPAAKAPEFDLVRIDAEGFALAAGRAEPGGEVEVWIGETLATTATAGPDGAFVAYFQTPPSTSAQSIRAAAADAGAPLPEGTEGQARDVSQPMIVLPAAREGEAPVVVAPSEADVKLVQPAPRAAPDTVTLDKITYDEDGRVKFGGRAAAGSLILIYLDNAKAAEAQADEMGEWLAQAPKPISAGRYDMRVDEVGFDGKVASRVETPFLREAVAKLAARPDAVTVQRGDSLWRMAEDLYGSGVRYTLIFDANAAEISDPDLIYPGQIFQIPPEKRADAG